MDGSVVEIEEYKVGREAEKRVTEFDDMFIKIDEEYYKVVKRWDVAPGDQIVFRFRIRNRCGILSDYSDAYTFNFNDAGEFQLGDSTD